MKKRSKAPGWVGFDHSQMFNLVIMQEDVCQRLLERILGIQIERLEFENVEHVIDPSIEGRGVRLDAYVKGEGTAFNIEMQAQTEYYLGCRLRYYQSVIDSDLLHKGDGYEDLPRSYIIFLCVHDSFGCGLPVYTIEPRCLENNDCQLDTRCTWIVLNGSAWVKEDDEKLRSLLQYIEDGTVTEGDDLVAQIDRLVVAANDDDKVMSEMISVSTVEANAERRVRQAKKFYSEVGFKQGYEAGEEQGLEHGLEQGIEQGLEQGLERGKREEAARISALINRLLADGREQDILLLGDQEALERLLKEYSL